MTAEELALNMDILAVEVTEFAHETGVNRTTIWRYLKGKSTIPKIFAKYVQMRVAQCND